MPVATTRKRPDTGERQALKKRAAELLRSEVGFVASTEFAKMPLRATLELADELTR